VVVFIENSTLPFAVVATARAFVAEMKGLAYQDPFAHNEMRTSIAMAVSSSFSFMDLQSHHNLCLPSAYAS